MNDQSASIIMLFACILLVVLTIMRIKRRMTRLNERYGDVWLNYQNGSMSIDNNSIYLASALNHRAKRSGAVTKDNCDAFICVNDQNMIYNDGSVEYRIPISAIEKIEDGVDSDLFNRNSDMMHEITIRLKVGSLIEMCIEESETGMRESKPGYNNTVVIDDLCLTYDDHNALFNHIGKLVNSNRYN